METVLYHKVSLALCFVALTLICLASITTKTHFPVITDRIVQRSVCVEHTSLNRHFFPLQLP